MQHTRPTRQFIRTNDGDFIPTDTITHFTTWTEVDKETLVAHSTINGHNTLLGVPPSAADALMTAILECTDTVINPEALYRQLPDDTGEMSMIIPTIPATIPEPTATQLAYAHLDALLRNTITALQADAQGPDGELLPTHRDLVVPTALLPHDTREPAMLEAVARARLDAWDADQLLVVIWPAEDPLSMGLRFFANSPLPK